MGKFFEPFLRVGVGAQVMCFPKVLQLRGVGLREIKSTASEKG
jgi:hypothetical protein